MAAKLDMPGWLIHMFARDVTVQSHVRWVTIAEWMELQKEGIEGLPKRGLRRVLNGRSYHFKNDKRIPYGLPAGGRRVHGHGYLVRCSGRQILTADILDAIDYGYYWLWDTMPRRPSSVHPALDDVEAVTRAHNTWYLDADGRLRWMVRPHRDIPAGSVVQGMPLAGRGDRIIQRSARYYVSSDVEHALRHGRFPWMTEPVVEPHQWE